MELGTAFYTRIYIALLLCVFAYPTIAQVNSTNDFGIWSGIEASTKIVKKLKGSAELQQRFSDNATQPSATLLQAGLDYKAFKNIKLQTNYRHSFKYSKNTNRIDFRINYKDKVYKRTWFSSTIKTQFDKDNTSLYIDKTLRFKYELEHKIKKRDFYPSVSNEWFYEITAAGNYFSRFRLNIGVSYALNKDQTINIGYTQNRDLNKTAPQTDHIAGIFYSINL